MLDKCKEYLKADDPVSGYQSLITDLRTGLDRICEGKKVRPMDMQRGFFCGNICSQICCYVSW